MMEQETLFVVKKNGLREEFKREKLLAGLLKACEKSGVPLARIEALVQTIEDYFRKRNVLEVSSRDIGELVMEHLVEIDEIAYVRFGCVYRKFKDVTFFLNEIERLLQKSKSTEGY
jgi:transcriptional repressor NrdR